MALSFSLPAMPRPSFSRPRGGRLVHDQGKGRQPVSGGLGMTLLAGVGSWEDVNQDSNQSGSFLTGLDLAPILLFLFWSGMMSYIKKLQDSYNDTMSQLQTLQVKDDPCEKSSWAG